MRLMRNNIAWYRKALLAWTSTWMLILPWVHVHPEVEHNHGNPGHFHHALTHTVFSTPLECESDAPLHDDTCPSGAHQHIPSMGHHGYALTHPEIAFSLAASSATPIVDKLQLSPSSLIEDVQAPTAFTISETAFHQDIVPALFFLQTALPLRAPPALLS